MMIKIFCKLFLEEFSDIILAIFIKMSWILWNHLKSGLESKTAYLYGRLIALGKLFIDDLTLLVSKKKYIAVKQRLNHKTKHID